MLSPESKIVYDILRRLTGDDDIYKIIEADEVMDLLPQELQLTKVQLSAMIKDLKDRDYINVKYFTPDEYCLLTMKRMEEVAVVQTESGEEVQEGEDGSTQQKGERISYDKNKGVVKSIKPGMVFLMSLLGALLGSAIMGVIVIVVLKFVA